MRNGLNVNVAGALLAVLLLAGSVPPESPVADAAMRGDVERVRELLREGADVNAAQGDGMTALHWAAERGDAELARMLLYAGANVDAVTRLGAYGALHLASRSGRVGVIEVLLAGGADPGARTSTGDVTPLHFAAASGSVAAVSALLEGGADPGVREDRWGQTPLMFAAAAGRTEAVRALLAAGADPAATAAVLDLAAREEEDDAAQERRDMILAALRAPGAEGGEREAGGSGRGGPGGYQQQGAPQRQPATPAVAATPAGTEAGAGAAGAAGTEAAAGAAAAAGAGAPGSQQAPEGQPTRREINERQRDRPVQPLSHAQLVGGYGGLTALLLAVRDGHAGAVMALLDGGADIDQVSAGDGTGPLLMATINGHFDLALALLERGADPSIPNDAGATPLYTTVNTQWIPKSRHPQPAHYMQQEVTYLELMRALLDAGVDPNARLEKQLWFTTYGDDYLGVDRMGATAFWRAAYALDLDAMKLLLEHSADPSIPTMKPPERRRRGEGGADEPDPSGLPPLPVGGPGAWPIHAASGIGYGEGYAANIHRHVPDGWLPAVRFLVEELGADVNARDQNGYNAVHHAAARGDNELILYLVEQGADVMAVSREGQTTVDMANGPVQRISPFPATIALLESLGAENNHNCVSC
jgi:ankyrin repeat protein